MTSIFMLQNIIVAKLALFVVVLLLWSYAFSLLLGFRLTGPFVVMISRMLSNDVARFCAVYVVICFGFATLLLVLQSFPIPGAISGWTAMGDNIYDLFLFIVNNGQLTGFNGVDQAWGGFFSLVSYVVILSYVLLMIIVLLNLLIAMMGDTYQDVQEDTEMQYVKSKAQILISLEGEMSVSDWAGITPYWIMDGGKPWLQMQIKNEAFLKMNEKETVAKQALGEAIATEPPETKEEAFAKADTNGDGKVTEEELARFEASIRQKVELEVLARLAMQGGVGGPSAPHAASLFVKPSELKGGGFGREGVYNVEGEK